MFIMERRRTMRRIDRLYRDHDACRRMLAAVESAARCGTAARFVVREMCFALLARLRDHMRREADLIASCWAPLSAKELTQLAEGHGDECCTLEFVLRRWLGDPSLALSAVRSQLSLGAAQMRSHIGAQEYKLFPAIEWVLSVDGAAGPEEPVAWGAVDESLTVREVVEQYPATEPLLRRFFVDPLVDGAYALDEVASRHGLDSRQLVTELEASITRSRPFLVAASRYPTADRRFAAERPEPLSAPGHRGSSHRADGRRTARLPSASPARVQSINPLTGGAQ
jgi:hypothetical protein